MWRHRRRMSEPVSRPVVLDATVLSNYASTDPVTWLTTTPMTFGQFLAVRTELEQAVRSATLSTPSMVLTGRIGIAKTAPGSSAGLSDGADPFDPAEAEALPATHTADGTLVTDDIGPPERSRRVDIAPIPADGLLVRGVVLTTN